LDEQASDIVSCTAGKATAVKVDVDAQGQASATLHGAPGSAEDECVRALLQPPRFEGGPGSLIHVVKPPPAE
jgi:hypothetical protein